MGSGLIEFWDIVGKNSSILYVPFLNLMSTLASRGGEVHVRVGGNTQDYAVLVDTLPQANGSDVVKLPVYNSNTTSTPTLLYTNDLLYTLNNVSNLVPVKWYLGQCPFPVPTL